MIVSSSLLAFIHIEKTAGTIIDHILRNTYDIAATKRTKL